MILRMRVAGVETQFGLEFLLGFRPMLPANVGESRVKVRLKQGWIRSEGPLQSGDCPRVVANLGPKLTDKQERLLGQELRFEVLNTSVAFFMSPV